MKESTVKINLTMNDKASDKLQGFKDVLKGLDTAVINSGKEISKLAGLFTRLKDNAKTAVGDINGLQKAIQGLNTSARTAASNIEQLGNKSQKAGTELKSLETNSNALVGLFSRLGFAVDRLAIEMQNLKDASRHVGQQLGVVFNQANNTSALSNHSRHVQQVTRDYNEMSRAMVGAVQMWGANKIGEGFKSSSKENMDGEVIRNRAKMLGLNENERNTIQNTANELEGKIKGSSNAEIFKVITEMYTEIGDLNEAIKMAPNFIKKMSTYSSVIKANGGEFNNTEEKNLIKGLERSGAFTNDETLSKAMDNIVKVALVTGVKDAATQVNALYKYSGMFEPTTDRGRLREQLAASDKYSGSEFGTSVRALGQKLTGKGMMASEYDAWNKLGAYAPGAVEYNEDGTVNKAKTDLKGIKNIFLEEYVKDPISFFTETLPKLMEKAGKDSRDKMEIIDFTSPLMGAKSAGHVANIIYKRDQFQKDEEIANRSIPGNQMDAIVNDTMIKNVDDFNAKMGSLKDNIGKVINEAFLPFLQAIVNVTAAIAKFVKEHPDATKIALWAAAYTGVALAIGGLVTWMGGLSGAVALVTTGFSMLLTPVRLVWGLLAGLGTIVSTVTGGLGAIAFALGGIWARIVTAANTAWAALRAGAAALIPGMVGALVLGAVALVAIFLFPEAFRNFQIFGSSVTTWAETITAKVKNVFWDMASAIAEFVVWAGNKIGVLDDKAAKARSDIIQKNLNTQKEINNQKVRDSQAKDLAANGGGSSPTETVKPIGPSFEFKDIIARKEQQKQIRQLAEEQAKARIEQKKLEEQAEKNRLQNEKDAEAREKKLKDKNTGVSGGGGGGYKGIREDQKESQFMAAELKELQALYQQGKMNLEEYFSKRVEITNDGINKEIAALQKQLSTAKNAKQAQQIQNKIDVLEKQRTANLADIQADKEKELINIESKRLTIKEKLAQLTGKTQEVELIKIEKEMADLRKSMGGNLTEQDDAMIKQIESIMKAKAAYNDLMHTVKKYEGEADLAHKKASSAAKLGEITATEAARRSEEAYRAEGEAIQALIPKLEELAQKTANPDMIKQIEELKIKSHELANQVGEDAKKMKSDVSGAFEGLFNDLSSGKGIKAALNNFAKNIVDTINKTLSKQMSETITNMLFGQEKNGSFTGGMGNFLQGIISPKGFNGGGSGGLGGLFGNMFGGSSGDGEQGGTAGSFAELGKAASMAMNGLTNMTTNGVTGATTALGENIAKTMMGTSVEMTATAALQQLAAAASSAAAALSSIGGGSGGGGGLLGNLFGGGSPASSSGGGFFESIGSAVGGIFGGFPSYDVGTDFVPKDMYALIHQGEAILPATAAEKFRQFVDGGGMNSQSAGPTIVNNNFTVNGSTTLQSQQQIAKLAADSLNRAARRNG